MKRALDRKKPGGFTMIELLVSTMLIMIIAWAVASTYKLNREMWNRGRDKVLLQQSCTWCAEAMARDIRAASDATLNGASDLSLFDRTDTQFRRYFINNSRLSTAAGQTVAEEICPAVTFELLPDADDVEEVRFVLTLKDRWENSATVRGSAHLRN